MKNQKTVLIVADHAGFARDIVSHWQMEKSVPAFTLMSSELWQSATPVPCDLTIVGPVRENRLAAIIRNLDTMQSAVIAVVEEPAKLQWLRAEHSRVLAMRHVDGWLDSVVLLGAEAIRRVEWGRRAQRAEKAAIASMGNATLGRFMVESRHSFNNALTSVLGNAELLRMDAAELPEPMREKIDTIHAMTLRLHEMMRRFSSLATEMQFSENESPVDSKAAPEAYASGT